MRTLHAPRTSLAPVTSLALAAVVLGATSARPCSIAVPTLTDAVVAPLAGSATADALVVPTNGRLFVRLDFNAASLAAKVRADTEESERTLDVDVEGSVAIVDLAPLAPSTSYTVTLSLPESVSFVAGGETREIAIVTAADDDTSAPAIDGAASVEVEHSGGDPLFGGISSCGPSEATNFVRVSVPPASADVAGWKLFRVDDAGLRQLRAFEIGVVETVVDREPASGTFAYELVAVDAAGNESAPHEVTVDISPFGCSSTGSAPATFALLAFVAVGLRARRRS